MSYTMNPTRQFNPVQGGFTLIEILIAVLVLSFGLLGLAMLQVTGLKYNSDSYMRTQATYIAADIMDRIRANRPAAETGDYVVSAAPGTPETCGESSGCATATDLANYDLSKWYALQKSFLAPGASDSSITRSLVNTASGQSLYQYTITMRWSERGTNLEQSWVLQICKISNYC